MRTVFAELEVRAVALREQLQALRDLLGELGRIEHSGVLAPVQDPGDHLAARGVLGLEDPALARGSVSPARVAELPVAAEVTLDQPRDPVLQEDLRLALDLAELPLRAPGIVPPFEVLRRGEVVLGFGGVGDLAADPREPEDPDGVPLVRLPDQIELPASVDQVEGVHLALLLGVAFDRVVGELNGLAAGDRRLDLG